MKTLSMRDRQLIAAVQGGLPLVPRPFAAIGAPLRMPENQVIERLATLVDDGMIKRLGVVVRHRQLGYTANAMVVWDVPDAQVDQLAARFTERDFVTLCYRRPRRPPHWPYNLFCMIHGRDRAEVKRQIESLVRDLVLDEIPHEVLFSTRCFKQRGAHYVVEDAQ